MAITRQKQQCYDLHTNVGLLNRVNNAVGGFTHVNVAANVLVVVAHERHKGLIREGEICDLIETIILLAFYSSIRGSSVWSLRVVDLACSHDVFREKGRAQGMRQSV